MRRKRKFLKNILPRSLYGRFLVIMVAPLFFVQLISTYVFFDRHWESVTRQLADNIGGQIKNSLFLWDQNILPLQQLKKQASESFHMTIDYDEESKEKPLSSQSGSWGVDLLSYALKEKLKRPFQISIFSSDILKIWIPTSRGALIFSIPLKKLLVKTTSIYILWSLGASIFFLLIAILFMRNQIRPLGRLAEAAENFGKGRDVSAFKPEGAIEVRKAGTAFIVMRDRIQRYLLDRTKMLAGVSHDLRTPLTRLSLQMAMLPQSPEVLELQMDVQEMERMIEAYLEFARGEYEEKDEKIQLVPFLRKTLNGFKGLSIDFYRDESIPSDLRMTVKPHSLNRCLLNLLSNAQRYSRGHVKVSLSKRAHLVDLTVEDDGPGIPEEERALVFKPFYRMEASRNQETGGVGLGLTIVKDRVRAHGGSIVLGESADLGGLKVQIRLPL